MLRANWLKTIFFNLKKLPFKQAIHLPILLFGKVDISMCEGTIKIAPPPNRKTNAFGSIIIGNQFSLWGYNHPSKVTTLRILGTMELEGRCLIAEGSCLFVNKGATLKVEKNVFIFNDVKIACNEYIEIGENTRIAWENQIYDTNFHYVVTDNNETTRINKPIFIGKNCWIGNRSTLGPGTKLADWCIVASNSLLNKDFSPNERCLVAGCPAKVVKEGVRRVHNTTTEKIINNFFLENKGAQRYIVTDDIEMHYS